MGSFLAHIFGADARTGIAMFQAITSGVARSSVLRAAAEAALKSDLLEYFEAIVLFIKPAVKARNDMAHHIWGTCEELPKALLLTDPKVWAYYSLATIEMSEDMMRNPTAYRSAPGEEVTIFAPPFPLDQVAVYVERDFRNVTAIALTGARFLNYLSLMARWPNNVGLHRLLLDEPLFQKALSQSNRARNKTAAPP